MSNLKEEFYDVPDDMVCEYKEVTRMGKYKLLELSDRHVNPDGISYEIIDRLFPDFKITMGKNYFVSDGHTIYSDDEELENEWQ